MMRAFRDGICVMKLSPVVGSRVGPVSGKSSLMSEFYTYADTAACILEQSHTSEGSIRYITQADIGRTAVDAARLVANHVRS